MTDLSQLKVSTTKFGAAKLAPLLELYDKDEVPIRAAARVPGQTIDKVVVRKTLSIEDGVVPQVWNDARAQGSNVIHGLLFLAIVFSHHENIETLRQARTSPFRGTVHRPGTTDTDNKKYSNVARVVGDMHYVSERTTLSFSYDLSPLFQIPGLHVLAKELLAIKLRTAGWDETNTIEEELLRLDLNEVLSVTPQQFQNWLSSGSLDLADFFDPDEGETATPGNDEELPDNDRDYFLDADDTPGPRGNFVFEPGHTPRQEGTVPVAWPTAPRTASLLHNRLQTKLYNDLVAIHGAECVGTELQTGQGTSIDVVVKTVEFCWFYEIKTGKTLKACIRQALPQLLEYAYWRDDDTVAQKLIVASKFAITPDAEMFMELLRKRFGLPLYYEQITGVTDRVSRRPKSVPKV